MSLDDFPRPLRPIAVRILAAIAPFYLPPPLGKKFRAAFEAERGAVTQATRGWGREHWEHLSVRLSTTTHAVQVASTADLMRHLALDVPVEDTVFRVYHPPAGGTPELSPSQPCLAVTSAALRDAIAKTTREVGDLLAKRQANAAVRQLFADEQALGQKLAGEAAATLRAGAERMASARRRIDTAAAASSACRREAASLQRALRDADVRAAELAERSDKLSRRLAHVQEERRRELASDEPGHGTPTRLAALEARTAAMLSELDAMAAEAQAIGQKIDLTRGDLETVRRRHRKEAEEIFDSAYHDARRLEAELRGTIAALAKTTEADKHWRRIEPLLARHGSDPQLVKAQLRALGLWQYGAAPGQPEKREASQQAHILLQEVERALAKWHRPSLRAEG